MSDVVIIGGGVIGLTTAYRLGQQGMTVTVIDRQQTGREASWAGAGMLPSFLPDTAIQSIASMFESSRTTWKSFSQELLEITGIDNEYKICGALSFDDTLDDPNSYTLEGSTLKKEYPWLNHEFNQARYHPEYAQVRNPRHLRALKKACVKLNVHFLEDCSITKVLSSNSKIQQVVTDQTSLEADAYILCAGAWSGQILESLGYSFALKPIRGQMLLYYWEGCPIKHVLECGKQYLVPRNDGHVLVGSTEEDVGFDRSTTDEGISNLKNFAEKLVPELKGLTPVRRWSGLRPFLSGKIPLIGQMKDHSNLWVAAGHYRWGLQLSYVTAGIILDGLLSDRAI